MRRATRTTQGKAGEKVQQILAATALLLVAAARMPAQGAAAEAQTPATEPQAPAVERRILVSLQERKLAVVEDGQVVKIYSVAVGKRSTPSPVGVFQIINRVAGPSYYKPGLVIPTGPENPLGTHWIGIDKKMIGIHGTNQPASIGRRASHGCIRMKNEDVAELFARVRVGDTVEIFSQNTAETARIFGTAAPAVLTAQAGPAAQTNLRETPGATAAAAR